MIELEPVQQNNKSTGIPGEECEHEDCITIKEAEQYHMLEEPLDDSRPSTQFIYSLNEFRDFGKIHIPIVQHSEFSKWRLAADTSSMLDGSYLAGDQPEWLSCTNYTAVIHEEQDYFHISMPLSQPNVTISVSGGYGGVGEKDGRKTALGGYGNTLTLTAFPGPDYLVERWSSSTTGSPGYDYKHSVDVNQGGFYRPELIRKEDYIKPEMFAVSGGIASSSDSGAVRISLAGGASDGHYVGSVTVPKNFDVQFDFSAFPGTYLRIPRLAEPKPFENINFALTATKDITEEILAFKKDEVPLHLYSSDECMGFVTVSAVAEYRGGQGTKVDPKRMWKKGQWVWIRAYPREGYRFAGWGGGAASEVAPGTEIPPLQSPISPSTQIQIGGDSMVSATFEPIPNASCECPVLGWEHNGHFGYVGYNEKTSFVPFTKEVEVSLENISGLLGKFLKKVPIPIPALNILTKTTLKGSYTWEPSFVPCCDDAGSSDEHYWESKNTYKLTGEYEVAGKKIPEVELPNNTGRPGTLLAYLEGNVTLNLGPEVTTIHNSENTTCRICPGDAAFNGGITISANIEGTAKVELKKGPLSTSLCEAGINLAIVSGSIRIGSQSLWTKSGCEDHYCVGAAGSLLQPEIGGECAVFDLDGLLELPEVLDDLFGEAKGILDLLAWDGAYPEGCAF